MLITPVRYIYCNQTKYQPFNNVPYDEVMWKPKKSVVLDKQRLCENSC